MDSKTGFNVKMLKLCKDGYWALERNARDKQYWVIHFDGDYPASCNVGPFGDLACVAPVWVVLR